MLSAEDNDRLTRVGPGTPMGALLRRYWTPALLAAELPEPGCAPVRVRLFGEDLVATRDRAGRAGLGRYPVHESGGIVWTYMGPADKQPPFRDFGTESLPPDKVAATKLHTTCNWVQAMEGNLDTSHISWLHQWDGVEDIPDDGSDKPGYPSNAMSWKFWRHDRAPRLEIEDTWYGFKYAGIRTTPNGNTHVRVTAYVVPYGTLVASVPWSRRQGLFVPMDDNRTVRYTFTHAAPPNVHGYGGENLFAVAPFTNSQGATGIRSRDYRADNDYQIDREVQRTSTFSGVADFVSQDLMVT